MPSSAKALATTVIIPAYNQGHYLAQAVESVLAQTDPDFEVVVVDDGSTDDTAQVAQGFSDPRVRYVYQENAGLSAARNAGIAHARGRYLTFLDSDDLFMPEKLALLVEALETESQAGLVAGQAIPIDEDGRLTGRAFDQPLPREGRQLLLGNPLHVGSVLLRRSWQEKVGLFDQSLRSYEDWDMWLRLALAGCPMRWVDKPVSKYRFHTAQMTRDGAQMTTATFSVLDNLFARSDLPATWREMRDLAYSRAYLRAAAQAYRAAEYEAGAEYLKLASALDTSLIEDNGAQLASIMTAWTDLPKISEPLHYLKSVYQHLPPELEALEQRKHEQLGELSLRLSYAAFEQNDMQRARETVRQAIRYQPRRLANRGVLSILVHSHAALLQNRMRRTTNARRQPRS